MKKEQTRELGNFEESIIYMYMSVVPISFVEIIYRVFQGEQCNQAGDCSMCKSKSKIIYFCT